MALNSVNDEMVADGPIMSGRGGIDTGCGAPYLGSTREQEIEMPTHITVNNNGPLLIEGDVVITDAVGKKFELGGRAALALCRCGQSGRKPFCDGSHRTCEFISTVAAYALEPIKPRQ
jgi:CDGSH-type Zn-finger protein